MEKEASITISKATIRKALAFLLIAGFIAFATMGLHWRAASGDTPDMRLVPVAVETVTQQPSYQVSEFYAGRVEARQRVNLAFEQAGKIAAMYVDEGEFVKAGDLIAKLDVDLLEASRDQTRSAIVRIRSQVELAKLTEERQKTLFEQGHSSEQRYDESRFNREALTAQLAETEAALRTIEINIEKSSLYAPFDAQVGARSVDTGAVRDAGMAIVTLLETSVQQARISVPTSRIEAMKIAENLSVSYHGEPISATILAIRADVNQVTRTQDVILTIAPENPIPFGELVELALPETRIQQGYWLPVEALVEGKKGLWNIFAVENDGSGDRVVRRAVEVIFAETGRVFVTANIGSEARLVASGTHRVVPGQYIDAMSTGEQ